MTQSQFLHGLAKFWRDLFTGKDNATYDLGRILWAVSTLWYLVVGTIAILSNKQVFDFVDAGTGLGLVLAGGGAALWAKKSTEVDMNEKL